MVKDIVETVTKKNHSNGYSRVRCGVCVVYVGT